MGGGPPEGRSLKAVQVGSPFGNFMPAGEMDIPLSFESLEAKGSLLGSGVLVAVDDQQSLLNVLARLVSFFKEESCGKCVPCREGTYQLSELIEKFQNGRGTTADGSLLKELAETMREFSLCGLGSMAPGPLCQALRDFPKEFIPSSWEKPFRKKRDLENHPAQSALGGVL